MQALHQSGSNVGCDFSILRSVMDVNDKQKVVMFLLCRSILKRNLQDQKNAVWGLSFKPETDDIRQAPSLDILEKLIKAGADLTVYDPEAMDNIKKVIGDKVKYAAKSMDAIKDAAGLLICTEVASVPQPKLRKIRSLQWLLQVIFDGRNLYELSKMENHGFTYHSIGRRTING